MTAPLMAGAVYDDLSPCSIVSVLPKKGRRKPVRYLSDRVTRVQYTDSGERQSTKVAVTLRNEDQEVFYDRDLMREGTVLGVRLGYPGLMLDAGQFVIKPSHTGNSSTITIEAKERKRAKMTREKLLRAWDKKPRSLAVREVLLNHFPASEVHVEDTTRIIESITQHGEHDWQFCWRQAQLAQYEMYIDETGVHWEKPKRGKRPSRLLRFVKNPLGLGEIIDFSFDGFGAGIPGRVKLSGRNPRTKKEFAVVVDRTTAEDLGELVEPARTESPERGDRIDRGDTGHELSRYTGARSEEEAKEIAQAIYKEARWGAMKMSLDTIGDPTVRSRVVVGVWGIGPALDGLWWVKQVEHTIGPGYTQKIDLSREGLADKLKIRRGTPKTLSGENRAIARDAAAATRALLPSGHLL